MADLRDLRKQLVNIRNSLIGLKGGLGRTSAGTPIEKEWLKWSRSNADQYRRKLNASIKYLDKIIGK